MKHLKHLKTFKILLLIAALLTPTAASAREVTIGTSIPVMAPLTGGSSYGLGVMPRLQLGLTDRIKLSLEAGAILSHETG